MIEVIAFLTLGTLAVIFAALWASTQNCLCNTNRLLRRSEEAILKARDDKYRLHDALTNKNYDVRRAQERVNELEEVILKMRCKKGLGKR
jgi:hypothetical protein